MSALFRTGGALFAAGSVAFGACAVFGSEEDAAPAVMTPEAGEDVSPPDGSPPEDAAGPCIAPTFACTPLTCLVRKLHVPNAPQTAFGMLSDATGVYWLASTDEPDAQPGTGPSKLLRAEKTGALDDAATRVLAVDQRSATVLAMEGDNLLWFTIDQDDAGVRASHLRRQRKDADCSTSCQPPQDLFSIPFVRFVDLRVVAPSIYFALSDMGLVYRISPDGNGVLQGRVLTQETFQNPTFAVTPEAVYVGGANKPVVTRIDLGTFKTDTFVTFDVQPGDGSAPAGAALLRTDCESLFAMRWRSLVRMPLAGDASPAPIADVPFNVWDLRLDAKYVYFAAVNGARADGVYALDRATRELISILELRALTLHVDQDGLYWHSAGAPSRGTVYMMAKQ